MHWDIFERLGVPCEETEDWFFHCKFTEPTIRASLLLHVMLHEMRHHDRITTRTRHGAGSQVSPRGLFL